jgi:glycosyltransferase involved in cell wall biosynthesis
MITVFTASYNRGSLLPVLYKSLCAQTYHDFEWVIVDDGSTDQTDAIVTAFQQENLIRIQYVKQKNGGKHRAINHGVKLATGELFFIIDHDDWLPEDSLAKLSHYYDEIRENSQFAGVCGMRFTPEGERIGGDVLFSVQDMTLNDFYYKYKYKGDLGVAFKTEILEKYPFPDFPGEKFCSESCIWLKISGAYLLRFFNENIYICKYLADGQSPASCRNRMKSPRGSVLLYRERLRMDTLIQYKIRNAINLWRFYFCLSPEYRKEAIQGIPFWSYFFFFWGFGMHLKDMKQEKRRI